MSSEGFLSRWSRRKQEVREAEQADRIVPAQPDPAEPEHAPEPAISDEPGNASGEPELSADEIARLPSLEALTAETDLSQFLRKGVPEILRNAALRRMWSLDPKIRDFVSEAREYAYDWNVPGGVPGSGVLPSSEEWARMAARIVGGPASDPEPGEARSNKREQLSLRDQPEAPAPEKAVASHADEAPPSSAEPAAAKIVPPSSEAEDQGDGGAAAQQAGIEAPLDTSSPVRRHGGAMPL